MAVGTLTESRPAFGRAACVKTPHEWDAELSGPPHLCSARSGWDGALIRRWRDTAAIMEQPPLDHHYVAIHLGGPKFVKRRHDGPSVSTNVEVGSITVVPAGTAFSWKTDGPIDFAHLYLAPEMIDRLVREEFDCEPRVVELIDCVARNAWLLGALLQAMLHEIERPAFASRLALDTLLQCFVVHLLRESSTMRDSHRNVRHALAPHRLRRVRDFIQANLAADLRLAELATVACSSPYHFSRAFRLTTGLSPYRYLIHQRIERGKALLCDDSLSIADAAKQCGFRSTRQFATMFKQICGVSPARFRRER